MVMPPCGTFHYAGFVPNEARRERGPWTLTDVSGADDAGGAEPVADNRLVGLEPAMRVAGSHLILEAARPHLAEMRGAAIELDRALLERLQTGDRLELARTNTADIGVSVRRAGQLLWAVGAITVVSLGPTLRARGGPAVRIHADKPIRRDTWVEVSVGGETSRLSDGDHVTVGDYRVTLVSAFKDGIPGQYENGAITRQDAGIHEAAVRAAAFLTGGAGGLTMNKW